MMLLKYAYFLVDFLQKAWTVHSLKKKKKEKKERKKKRKKEMILAGEGKCWQVAKDLLAVVSLAKMDLKLFQSRIQSIEPYKSPLQGGNTIWKLNGKLNIYNSEN